MEQKADDLKQRVAKAAGFKVTVYPWINHLGEIRWGAHLVDVASQMTYAHVPDQPTAEAAGKAMMVKFSGLISRFQSIFDAFDLVRRER